MRPRLHHTIRKYTLAMLETFNGLFVELEGKDDNGDTTYTYKTIPIKYISREKINLLDEVEEKQLLNGNYNFLPRTSLALSSIVKNNERQSNKFCKIATNDFGEFVYNAVAYDFAFDMSIMCRGMNEASNVIEQISYKFNPTYTLLINEIPNQTTPTSVPIQLVEIGMEDSEYEETSTNIVIVQVSMMLKGNFYEPVREMHKVKNFKMFMNMWYYSDKNEMNRAKLYDFDVVNDVPEDNPDEYILLDDNGEFGYIVPVITDIIITDPQDDETILSDVVNVGDKVQLIVELKDPDNKYPEIQYLWDVPTSVVLTNSPLTSYNHIDDGSRKIFTCNATGIVEVKVIAQDVHGNNSNLFIKQITVV